MVSRWFIFGVILVDFNRVLLTFLIMRVRDGFSSQFIFVSPLPKIPKKFGFFRFMHPGSPFLGLKLP